MSDEKPAKIPKTPSAVKPVNILSLEECRDEVLKLNQELVILSHSVTKSSETFFLIHKLIAKRFSELNDRQCNLLANRKSVI